MLIGSNIVCSAIAWIRRGELELYLDHSPDHNYRAMHFSAKRGIAIACRLSVRLSVCL